MQFDEEQIDNKILQQLKANNAKLSEINSNMLKVFWIVAIFALLYFGLMIYMLFFR
jgi:capsule polysaccharide export protein KpsE/RkpR